MCHVLVIEDQWIIADYIADIAFAGGATSVSIAATEMEAVDAADSRCPAIILSDVKLLEGTGPKAVGRIIDKHGARPVIYITASPEMCQSGGAGVDVLDKPIDRSAVLRAFARLAPL